MMNFTFALCIVAFVCSYVVSPCFIVLPSYVKENESVSSSGSPFNMMGSYHIV